MSGKKSSSVSGNPFGFRASSRSSESSKPERSSQTILGTANTERHNSFFKLEGIWGKSRPEKTERAASSPHVDRFFKPEKHDRIFTPDRSNIDSSERRVRIFAPSRSHTGVPDKQAKAFTPSRSSAHAPDRQVKTLVPRRSGSDIPDRHVRTESHSKSFFVSKQSSVYVKLKKLLGAERTVKSGHFFTPAKLSKILILRNSGSNASERQVKSDSRGRPEIKAKSAGQGARGKIAQPRTKGLSVALKSSPWSAGKAAKSARTARIHHPYNDPVFCATYQPYGPDDPLCNCHCDESGPTRCYDPNDDNSVRTYDHHLGRRNGASSVSTSNRAATSIKSSKTTQPTMKPNRAAPLMLRPTGHSSPRVLQNRPVGETTKVMTPQKTQKASLASALRDLLRPEHGDRQSSSQNFRSSLKAARDWDSADVALGRTADRQTERYSTQDSAARAGLREANNISRRTGLEAGGVVYQNSDGTYSYTTPITGTETQVEPFNSRPPRGTDSTAYYHTHPYSEDGDDVNFSEDDKWVAEDQDADGYLGTPNGDVRAYEHETDDIREVGHDPISDEEF